MSKYGIYFTLFLISMTLRAQNVIDKEGAIIRTDTSKKNIYLCFTGHVYFDGFNHVLKVLKKNDINASFFLTGDFIRNHTKLVKSIVKNGHFVGAHSDKHILYCDWTKRDSLLFSKEEIKTDIAKNLAALKDLKLYPTYFMPPYEWYNKAVVEIAKQLGQTTINFSPGTRSNADYTSPEMANYVSSSVILKSIFSYEELEVMNGFHLLIHPGVTKKRKDKFYMHLDSIISELQERNYQFAKF